MGPFFIFGWREMLMELGKVWLPCSKQLGFDSSKLDRSVSKGLGWYFPQPECEEELIMVGTFMPQFHLEVRHL